MRRRVFSTEWPFDCPSEQVWHELGDFGSFPFWWRDGQKFLMRKPGSEPQVGSILDREVKGSWFYTLRYSLEIIARQKPFINEHIVSGDLVGRGKRILAEHDGGTVVQHHLHVTTSSPIFNTLASIGYVRRLMERNLGKVMKSGYAGSKRRLADSASESSRPIL